MHGLKSCGGGNVDDGTTATSEHGREKAVREVHHGSHIEHNFLLLLLSTEAIEGTVGRKASIVNQDIDGKVQLLSGCEKLLPRLRTT